MQGTKKKKLHIETWGCQMNVADSEKMSSSLGADYQMSSSADDADVIILFVSPWTIALLDAISDAC